MCKSLELIEQMGNIVTEMHSHIKELREKQYDINLMRTDIQHQLENETVDPTSAYNLAKAYHILSKERRVIADEIELIQETILERLMDLEIPTTTMKIKLRSMNTIKVDVKTERKHITLVS